MGYKTIIAIIIIIGFLIVAVSKTQPTSPATVEDVIVEDVIIETKPAILTHEVIYNDSGYTPMNLTVKMGDTVVFKNQSSAGMWTGSAMHPTHMVYSGTSLDQHCPDSSNTAFDECKADQPGASWRFTFNKIGTFGYHNHVKVNHFGKITVE